MNITRNKSFKNWVLLFAAAVLIQFSCLRLDDNLYNISDKISQYKFDDYSGEQDFILDNNFKIQDTMRHLFNIQSKGEKDDKSYNLFALYLGDIRRIKTDTVIMYCHGNKWHMDFYWQRAKLMAHIGSKHRYGVLMIDYRGYGLSEGEPSEDGLYADVTSALNWLKANGLTNDRLIMYGFSMGTAPATKLTAHPDAMIPSKLVLEAPFASAAVMAADAGGLNLPGSYITNLKISNAEEIKLVNQPFLWMHGTGDNFLSIKTHGEVVFKNYHGVSGTAERVTGADHGEVPEKMGFDKYLQVMRTFIAGK